MKNNNEELKKLHIELIKRMLEDMTAEDVATLYKLACRF